MRPALIVLAAAACGDFGAQPPDAAWPDAPPAPVDAAPAPDAAPFTGTITGRVTSGGAGVAGATVRFGGHPAAAATSADGSFSLTVAAPPVELGQLALTAGKPGYWNAGVRVTDPASAQEIEIEALSLVDDPAYEFKSPDAFEAAPHCIHCHPHQYDGWSQSAHGRAARDEQLHDLYNGTAMNLATQAACEARGGAWLAGKSYGAPGATMKCYVPGGAVLADLNPGVCGGAGQPTCDDPTAPAANRPADVAGCADCHAPASDPHVPGATNLNDVAGIGFDKGVHCDFCHKIESVTVNERPGVNGAINLRRPGPAGMIWSDPEVFFGPYSDVIVFFMGGSPQPQFRTSEFCSGCHQWSEPGFRPADKPLVDLAKWGPDGLPIQDTYYEWTRSPQAATQECHACHEPAQPWETATIDLAGQPPDPFGTRGWPRAYGEVRSHAFAARPAAAPGFTPAPGDVHPDDLRDPIAITLEPTRTATTLSVTVRLENRGAGHSIPSGTPSRALLLLVTAEAAAGPLDATGGYTVPAYTGALASGVVGVDATLVGDQLTLPAPWPATTGPGTVVRFVQASGVYADYPGTRWFADPARTPVEKGLEIVEPAGTATILSIAGATATLDRVLPVPGGATFLAGAPTPGTLAVDDELPVSALAGAPGWAFGKVMVDSAGAPGVVFFRAVDIAADNRIPAGAEVTTTHDFDVTGASGAVTVTATLLYRKFPYPTAWQRAWLAVDQARKQVTVTVP